MGTGLELAESPCPVFLVVWSLRHFFPFYQALPFVCVGSHNSLLAGVRKVVGRGWNLSCLRSSQLLKSKKCQSPFLLQVMGVYTLIRPTATPTKFNFLIGVNYYYYYWVLHLFSLHSALLALLCYVFQESGHQATLPDRPVPSSSAGMPQARDVVARCSKPAQCQGDLGNEGWHWCCHW